MTQNNKALAINYRDYMDKLNNTLFHILFFFTVLMTLLSSVSYAQGNTENGITFDLEEVEIKDLIRFMAETTGRNFIVDNSVNGKVTAISPNPVSEDKAMIVFESILKASGYAVVPEGDIFRITPRNLAPKSALDILDKKTKKVIRPSEVVTKLIELENVSVSSVLPILQGMVSPNAVISSYEPKNMLIITDNWQSISRIENLANRLDKSNDLNDTVSLIPVKYADVLQVAEIIDRIFSGQRTQDGQKAEIIPEVGSNTLIVVAGLSELRQIEKLVQKLDNGADEKVRSLDIVYLRHADAVDLANVLNDIVTKVEEGAQENVASGTTADKAIKRAGSFRSNVSIVADESTNALVISAEPADMVTLKEVIASLDVRRLQVYIEALIMEVSADMSNQFGVEWRSAEGLGSSSGLAAFGGQTFDGGISSLAENPLGLPSGMAFGIAGANISFRGTEYANIGFLVNALQSESSVNILSTPQILTLDNEEAEIIVGDNVPFVTGTYTNSNGAGNPFQTIERQDVGLTLRIKPQISENGFIRLNMYQEISSVAEQSNASDLITRKRSMKTTVVVPNQQMVALGGLIREDVNQTHQQVPCLGGIFGLGELFKSSGVQNAKTNLMVFIRPKIINTFGDVETITQEKYLQMRKLQLAPKHKGSSVVDIPEIPEADIVPESMRYSKEQYKADKEAEEKSKDETETHQLEPVQPQKPVEESVPEATKTDAENTPAQPSAGINSVMQTMFPSPEEIQKLKEKKISEMKDNGTYVDKLENIPSPNVLEEKPLAIASH